MKAFPGCSEAMRASGSRMTVHAEDSETPSSCSSVCIQRKQLHSSSNGWLLFSGKHTVGRSGRWCSGNTFSHLQPDVDLFSERRQIYDLESKNLWNLTNSEVAALGVTAVSSQRHFSSKFCQTSSWAQPPDISYFIHFISFLLHPVAPDV